MKIHVLAVLIGFFIILGSSVSAQTLNVKPGLLPDNPLIIFQDLYERFQLTFAFSPEAKANFHIRLAEKRLAELNLSIYQNKTKLIPIPSEKYDKELNETEDEINATKSSGKNVTELAERVAAATFKHELVLQRVLGKVPDQAKDSIEHAIEQSSHGHETAVEHILENGNITGTVNITFTIGNQTFTQTFNVTSRGNKTHVEEEGQHNETCRQNCNESIVIIKPGKGHNEENRTNTNITSVKEKNSTNYKND